MYDKIIEVYPELTINANKDYFANGTIRLQDDGDGQVYIAEWNYSKPLPEGMKVGKN